MAGAAKFSLPNDELLASVREVFAVQSKALARLAEQAGQKFIDAIGLMKTCQGRVIVCGMGKSGLIGKKIAATLASVGTPSFFMHPGEAYHGDLGMIMPDDILLLISYSGETDEVLKIIPSIKHFGNKYIAITGNLQSTLAKNADVVLDARVEKETCPNNLAPTTSTTVALAIGDALASTISLENKFTPMDFAKYHPGGSLGKRLLTKVKDVMLSEDLPYVTAKTPLTDVLLIMTETRTGLALVMDGEELLGICTDGDLRRFLLTGSDVRSCLAQDMMTVSPCTISESDMLVDAEQLMRERHIKWLVVTNQQGRVTGMLEWSQ